MSVQTLARCFPLEAHTWFLWFQYLPAQARVWLLQHLPARQPRTRRGIHHTLQLFSHRQVVTLFPDAYVRRESVLGLTKSYMECPIGVLAISQPGSQS
jgi:hypothetical protein